MLLCARCWGAHAGVSNRSAIKRTGPGSCSCPADPPMMAAAPGFDKELRVQLVKAGQTQGLVVALAGSSAGPGCEQVVKVPLCYPADNSSQSAAVQSLQVRKIVLSPGAPGSLLVDEGMQLMFIPEELRQHKQHLLYLEVDCVCLSSLPEWLGEFECLETLCLNGYNFKLRALPATLGNLQKLTTLMLPMIREMTDLPNSIARLSALVCLSFTAPSLQNISPLRTLTALQRLNMSSASLRELPEWIGGFTALTALRVKLHAIRRLPVSLWTLTGLLELHVGGDALKEISTQIEKLSKLQDLVLDCGEKLLELPASMGNLTELRRLTIATYMVRPPHSPA